MSNASAGNGSELLEVFVEGVSRSILVEAGVNLEAVACVNKSLATAVRQARDTYRRVHNSADRYPDPNPANEYRVNWHWHRVRCEHEKTMRKVESLEDGLPQHRDQELWPEVKIDEEWAIQEMNDEYQLCPWR